MLTKLDHYAKFCMDCCTAGVRSWHLAAVPAECGRVRSRRNSCSATAVVGWLRMIHSRPVASTPIGCLLTLAKEAYSTKVE